MNEASIQYIVWREFGLAIEKEKESIEGLERYTFLYQKIRIKSTPMAKKCVVCS